MKGITVVVASVAFALAFVSFAAASPRSLSCEVSGDAGSHAFQLVYDEDRGTVSAIWTVARPYAGQPGVDEGISPTISVAKVSAGFAPIFPDSAGYIVELNRTNGSVVFTLTPGGENFSHSYGQCRHSTSPSQF